MQTLGISDSTPRTESRLKSLLWPSVETATDVDYLGTQGYWICTVVAVITLVLSVLVGRAGWGVLIFLLYYLGGVGVRERSRYAAITVFVFYLLEILTSGPSVPRIIFAALLFANLRATWIAAGWRPESEEAILPPRLSETWGDKLSDQLPQWLWPKVRILYYVLSAIVFFFIQVGLIAVAYRLSRR
jgi:hypothetical protein